MGSCLPLEVRLKEGQNRGKDLAGSQTGTRVLCCGDLKYGGEMGRIMSPWYVHCSEMRILSA